MKILISPIDETGIKYAICLHIEDAVKIADAINSGRRRYIPLKKTDPKGWADIREDTVAIRIPSQGGGTGYFDKYEVLDLIIKELKHKHKYNIP